MTRPVKRDPLLVVATVLLWFLTGLMAAAAAICIIVMPVIVAAQDKVAAGFAAEGYTLEPGALIGALLLALACAAVLCALLGWLFLLLRRMVDTVAQGDPFVPENASRLTRMAWIALATQILLLPMAAMAMFISSAAKDATLSELDITIEPNGLLLVLILFILARVFRHGTMLRDEVEGTV